MKQLILFFALLFGSLTTAHAQIEKPVTWSFASKSLKGDEAVLIMTAKIDKGWHVYSQFIDEGGPIPTSFTFKPSPNYELIGKVTEKPKADNVFDKTFNMQIASFKDRAIFEQKVRLKVPKAKISGIVEFMVCNDHQCLPPTEVEYTIEASATPSSPGQTTATQPATSATTTAMTDSLSASPVFTGSDSAALSATAAKASLDSIAAKSNTSVATSGSTESTESLLSVFIQSFLFGFVALLMPCIFPMIPLTVSFFTKRAPSRAAGIKKAVLFGLSIIVIYVLLGVLITGLLGADTLNQLASNAVVNIVFFVVLVVFAASFFGAFEMNLPASWSTKADEKADQGGFIGMFFMALALALASFSCTGPLIGSLLVQAASGGNYMGPIMGMLGFSTALAIPFTLFAIFPSWLQTLPKSGGWLNSVKVVLGFIELAFALKFLSAADLAYHWGILDREIFLVLWIVIFALMGMYLLGKLKFSHDSDVKYVSVPRLFLAMASLSFSLYMVPGLWGAPLKAISAFAPPMGTQDFDLSILTTSGFSGGGKPASSGPKKYSGIFHAPHGIDAFFDYEEGMAYAKKVGKPVLLDFTGHSCVNCRKMEANVWSDPEVLQRIKNDYVLISLYVDDRTKLDPADVVTSKAGKELLTVGKKWSSFQEEKYATNSQPYYVLLDNEGNNLVPAQAYNPDIPNYVQFLNSGTQAFKK